MISRKGHKQGCQLFAVHYKVLLVIMLLLCMLASLHLGHHIYSPAEVWQALFAFDGSASAIVVSQLRVPRILAACAVGAALGVCGLLLQAVLRNPLADPGVLGVNAGASFAVVLGYAVLGVSSFAALCGLALLGAVAATGVLYALIALSQGRLTPVTLVLAGVTVAALLSALTQLLLVVDEHAMESLLFWLAGSFSDRDTSVLKAGLPVLCICLMVSLAMSDALDTLQVGDQAAQGLGLNVNRFRLSVLALTTVLTAVCVTVAGPVGFVGLVAPHLARLARISGYRERVVATALVGAFITVLADIAARLVVAPQEAPVTALLAVIGAPTLLTLVRRHT